MFWVNFHWSCMDGLSHHAVYSQWDFESSNRLQKNPKYAKKGHFYLFSLFCTFITHFWWCVDLSRRFGNALSEFLVIICWLSHRYAVDFRFYTRRDGTKYRLHGLRKINFIWKEVAAQHMSTYIDTQNWFWYWWEKTNGKSDMFGVAFDATNYYIFIFETSRSSKPCQRFLTF